MPNVSFELQGMVETYPPGVGYLPRFRKQSAKAVFRELGSVVTVETRWSLEVVFPSRAVFSWAARQSHNPPRKLVGYHR
jgi:hypothetical protein